MSFYNASEQLINSGLICAYTKTHQAETITSVINWCWSGRGDRAAKCQENFIYLYFFLIGGSSAGQSISVQSLLFSVVIKEGIDLLADDSYLLPPPPVLCFAPLLSPRGGKVWSVEAEALHFIPAECSSTLTLRFKFTVKIQCKGYTSGQADFSWIGGWHVQICLLTKQGQC